MNPGKTIFSQIMSFIPKYEFDKRVIKYKGNYRIRLSLNFSDKEYNYAFNPIGIPLPLRYK